MNIERISNWFKFEWQIITRGWSDEETWSLDMTIAEFTLPRLKRFKEVTKCYPDGFTFESWKEALDKMIFAMEYCINYERVWENADTEKRIEIDNKVKEGLELFGKYFRALWHVGRA